MYLDNLTVLPENKYYLVFDYITDLFIIYSCFSIPCALAFHFQNFNRFVTMEVIADIAVLINTLS